MRLTDTERLRAVLCTTASIAGAIAVGGCASTGYVPPEAINPPTRAFAKATADFTAGVRKDETATYRQEVRRDDFTKLTLAVMKNPAAATTTLKDEAPKIREFLCLPRYGYDRITHRVAYLDAVAATLNDRAKDPADSLSELFVALSASYTIGVTDEAPPDKYDAWLKDPKGGQHCVEVIDNADPLAVRDYVGEEFSILGAKAALETIWSVIEPLVTGILSNVDRERRAAAIRDYFANADNVKALKDQLSATESFLVKEFGIRQRRSAGEATVAAAVLFEPTAAHWQKIVVIANRADCKQSLPKLADNKSDPRAVACVNEAMSAAAGPLKAALDAANGFDAAVEMQLPKERLSAQVDTLRDIALGKQPAKDQVKALWAALSRYVALFQTARGTVSDENRKKIRDALDALAKALGG